MLKFCRFVEVVVDSLLLQLLLLDLLAGLEDSPSFLLLTGCDVDEGEVGEYDGEVMYVGEVGEYVGDVGP